MISYYSLYGVGFLQFFPSKALVISTLCNKQALLCFLEDESFENLLGKEIDNFT